VLATGHHRTNMGPEIIWESSWPPGLRILSWKSKFESFNDSSYDSLIYDSIIWCFYICDISLFHISYFHLTIPRSSTTTILLLHYTTLHYTIPSIIPRSLVSSLPFQRQAPVGDSFPLPLQTPGVALRFVLRRRARGLRAGECGHQTSHGPFSCLELLQGTGWNWMDGTGWTKNHVLMVFNGWLDDQYPCFFLFKMGF